MFYGLGAARRLTVTSFLVFVSTVQGVLSTKILVLSALLLVNCKIFLIFALTTHTGSFQKGPFYFTVIYCYAPMNLFGSQNSSSNIVWYSLYNG